MNSQEINQVRNLNGYRVIYNPSHPKAMSSANWLGFVYEHIAEAEKALGRAIREEEIVHHLNGDRSDNRIRNLLVLERGQHMKLHAWLNRGAPFEKSEGEQGMNSGKSKEEPPKPCLICGRISGVRNKYCSPECSSVGSQKVPRPDKSTLASDIEQLSWLAIGRKYGVSDNAARKWARKYNLL